MNFVKVGAHIVNLSQIAWVELIEGGFGKRIEIHFVGGGEKLDMHGEEGVALVATLNASEVASSPR
jgi:hypothetical protein